MLNKVRSILKRKQEASEPEPVPERIFKAAMKSTSSEFLQSMATTLMATEGDSKRYWDIMKRIWWLEHG